MIQVEKKILDINPKAFYTLCDCHSLNLVLCDITNSCPKATSFFRVLQHIYFIFFYKKVENFTRSHNNLTLKSLP